MLTSRHVRPMSRLGRLGPSLAIGASDRFGVDPGGSMGCREGPEAAANVAFRTAGVNRRVGSRAIRISSWGTAYRGYI
jgi:hypothetical protein